MAQEDFSAYFRGQRSAWVSLLGECIRYLGYDREIVTQAGWILEREEAISALRELCEEFGDNNWDNDTHLADIINKHLSPYLGEK